MSGSPGIDTTTFFSPRISKRKALNRGVFSTQLPGRCAFRSQRSTCARKQTDRQTYRQHYINTHTARLQAEMRASQMEQISSGPPRVQLLKRSSVAFKLVGPKGTITDAAAMPISALVVTVCVWRRQRRQ